jgi:hypothetical protein
MLKGKNLWIALGVGAVAYYLWMQNKKKQAVSAPASVAFTGDLDVPQYQNASGRYVKKQLKFGRPAGTGIGMYGGSVDFGQ